MNSDQSDNTASPAGAAYAFTGLGVGPRLTLVPDGSGGYFVRFNGTPDLTDRLHRAASVTGPWDTIDTQTGAAPGQIEFHDPFPQSVTRRFTARCSSDREFDS